MADILNPPLTTAKLDNFSNSTFIDDNGMLVLCSTMHDALQQSLLSAFLISGMPGQERCDVCLQDDKWDHEISHLMQYLGFIINIQAMTVSWPFYKWAELFQELASILLLPSRQQQLMSHTASILGKLWSAIQISPCFFSLLQPCDQSEMSWQERLQLYSLLEVKGQDSTRLSRTSRYPPANGDSPCSRGRPYLDLTDCFACSAHSNSLVEI